MIRVLSDWSHTGLKVSTEFCFIYFSFKIYWNYFFSKKKCRTVSLKLLALRLHYNSQRKWQAFHGTYETTPFTVLINESSSPRGERITATLYQGVYSNLLWRRGLWMDYQDRCSASDKSVNTMCFVRWGDFVIRKIQNAAFSCPKKNQII